MATFEAKTKNGDKDEILSYLNGRYISAPEALWRLYEFRLIGMSPSTYRLPVHLEGKAFHVLGKVGEQRYEPRPSQLEAFFILNQYRKKENEH